MLQPEKDGVKGSCYDIAFKPGMILSSIVAHTRGRTASPLSWYTDGSELVTGIGNRVLVYETAAGDLLHSLRGHKVLLQ